ncbi:ABC transporter ATP-binding protein [Halocatena halophila]|uniref:ABC transporter ATP-binding protein n=1 Tax=Halocatena halophila TaxID=2814576 RepID=UPI002ECFB458
MSSIDAESVTKRYGSTRGIADVTFRVGSGESFGILGPAESGKTTLVRTLMGVQRPDTGSITIEGHDLDDRSSRTEMKRSVGFLPSSPSFDTSRTGRAVLEQHATLKAADRSDRLPVRLDISTVLDDPIRTYDDRDRRFLSVALAFMHDPSLVIMDEPFTALDRTARAELQSFLEREHEAGTSLLLATSRLDVVNRLCDRVGVLRNGHLVDIRPGESLPPNGGRRVRFITTAKIDSSDFNHAERISTTETGLAAENDERTTVELFYTGPLSELCERLSSYPIEDLTVEPPTLASVLAEWYGVRLTASGGDQLA